MMDGPFPHDYTGEVTGGNFSFTPSRPAASGNDGQFNQLTQLQSSATTHTVEILVPHNNVSAAHLVNQNLKTQSAVDACENRTNVSYSVQPV